MAEGSEKKLLMSSGMKAVLVIVGLIAVGAWSLLGTGVEAKVGDIAAKRLEPVAVEAAAASAKAEAAGQLAQVVAQNLELHITKSTEQLEAVNGRLELLIDMADPTGRKEARWEREQERRRRAGPE